MSIFDLGKKAREEQERLLEEERIRKAEEEARQRALAKAEEQKRLDEEAEKRRLDEEVRKFKAAHEAEQKRKAEAEEARRKAEEEARLKYIIEEEYRRKAAAEAERQRKAIYNTFASHTNVDCKVFAEAGFICDFDDMEYTANITPANEYIYSSYLFNDEYRYEMTDRGRRIPKTFVNAVGLDLRMLLIEKSCVFFPRINVRARIYPALAQKTIEDVYIKVGENRYAAHLPDVTIDTNDCSVLNTREVDYATLPLGYDDISILREIVTGHHQTMIRLGKIRRAIELNDHDIQDIKSYLDVCDQAGVFQQAQFMSIKAQFNVITKFND